MAETIRMPEVLANTSEAAVQAWLVAVGDLIEAGQTIAEIETEKATVDLAAERGGIVVRLLADPGQPVAVGDPIMVVRREGEPDEPEPEAGAGNAGSLPAEAAGRAEAPAALPPESASAGDPSGPAVDGQQSGPEPADADRARGPHSGEGRAEGAPARPTSAVGARTFASPLARRLAGQHGIEVDQLTGTGPGGRIVRRDIEAHLEQLASAAVPSAAPSAAEEPTGEGEQPSSMRRAIARRLTESKQQIPHFYVKADCRVDELLEVRRRLNESGDVKISVNDFIVRAVALAHRSVPEMNAMWVDDRIVRPDGIDVAIAVSLEDGLVAPVLRGVDRLAISEIGTRSREAAERARAGRLRQADLAGGSVTISNLGMYGVDEFTAIINPPHSGILAVGAARACPVVDAEGALAAAMVMTVTLSADHRVIDGAVAARWMDALRSLIEHPLCILA